MEFGLAASRFLTNSTEINPAEQPWKKERMKKGEEKFNEKRKEERMKKLRNEIQHS